MTTIRTALFGLGAIGAGIGRLAAERPDIELVAAIDSAHDKAGKPLYDVLGVDAAGRPNPAIEADVQTTLAAAKPQAVLHATGSYLPDVLAQLIECARAGAHVVSTCEELSYPWRRHPELAKQLDAEAQAQGVALLGTGINPGFVMDTLVATLSGVCQRVERVRLARIVDVSTRREQLQRKVGVGLSPSEFAERLKAGRFGHVGLQESCWLVAESLGWRLAKIDEQIEAVTSPDERALGMRQTARGTIGDRIVIEAVVQMSAGAGNPHDEIEIDGTPPVHVLIEGGVPGDSATAALVVNALPHAVALAPGLHTMLDLPPVTGRGVA